MFKVGEKIVCIRTVSEQDALKYIPNRPVLNGIYTVRADVLALEEQYVFLSELKNPPGNWAQIGYSEPPFWHGLFRPIVSRPTSIAVFEEILRKVDAPSRVDEVAHHA